jgi:type I restriction enzyme S subunit
MGVGSDIMKLKPYPKYKDSEIEWIGEIPEGWDVIKIKHIAGNCSIPVQTGPFGAQLHADDYVNEGIPFILIRNVNHGKINNTNIPFVSEEDAERLFMYRLKADDIVFSRVGSLGRAALVTNREEGWLISGQMLRLRLKDKRINRNYLVYLFQSKLSEEYVSYESVGSTRESLNTEILSNFILPLPPLPDQTAIANFLDKKNAKIDAVIEKDKKLIALLKEKRTALINHAVTKGLDPNVKLKDSGIPWIGEIPEGWEIRRIKNLCVVNGRVGWKGLTTNDYVDKGPLLLGAGNIQNNELVFNKYFHIPKDKYDESPEIKIRTNDVLLVKVGATIGKSVNVSRVEQDMTVNAALFVLRPRDKIFSRHFNYLLQTRFMQDQININVAENARGNLFERDIKEIGTLKVPYEQQTAIANFLDKATSRIDKTIKLIEKKIKLLEEYKKSLIHYVVTGKVDVRGIEA